MKTYAGIDLHSSNNCIGVINAKDKRLYSKRHDNRTSQILSLQSMITRNRGLNFSGAQIKRFNALKALIIFLGSPASDRTKHSVAGSPKRIAITADVSTTIIKKMEHFSKK